MPEDTALQGGNTTGNTGGAATGSNASGGTISSTVTGVPSWLKKNEPAKAEAQPATVAAEKVASVQEKYEASHDVLPESKVEVAPVKAEAPVEHKVELKEEKAGVPVEHKAEETKKPLNIEAAQEEAREEAEKKMEESKKVGAPVKKGFLARFFRDKKKDKKAEAEAKAVETKEKAVKAALDAPFDPKKLTKEERQSIIEAEKMFNDGLASIKDLIAPSSFEVAYDHVRVEGQYAQTLFVYSYPRYIDTNWLAPLINFDVTVDISQFVYPIDSTKIMKKLKTKVAQIQSSIRINAEKGNVRDPALETALEDAETLRTQIQRGQEKFFQFGLYVTVYSDDPKTLKKVTKQLESILGGKLVLTKRADLRSEHGFNSCLPQATDEIGVYRNMNTSPLSSTFPFSSTDLTSNDGILYGLNRHNDSLIIFDRFSLENANSVVFAKSGAGKSYAVKLEILRSMMVGTDVIVIDPENEYEALAQSVGGSYLNVSLNSDRRINPFDLPIPYDADDVQPGDLLRSSVINLNGLLKLMLGDLTAAEEALIDKALIDTYATKGITMDTPNPQDFEPPTMEDFHSVLGSMEGATSLAQRLEKYTTGTFAGIFNKPTNIDMDNQMVVFSIRDLEDALRPIAMYIILDYVWTKVRSQLKKRIMVVDEAWSMMQHEDSAKFLFGLVKRARKYYLGITTITQDVEDFMNHDHGRSIVTNSSMQLLLKQSPASIELLGKFFNLTEGEKYMLLNSGVGQGLFFAGLKHVAIQVIASYIEDKIVTTDPEEVLKQRAEFS